MLQTRVSYNVFKTINTKRFLNKVLINGNLLSSLIKKMHLLHKDKIVDTRCLGLMAGVEFKNNQIALKTYEKMSKNGLISTLIQGNIIRLTPPLTVSAGEIRKAIKIITQSL